MAFTVVEAIGGWWSHSIALLAEAAHMLADSASLILAIIAIRIGKRAADDVNTYGHQRYQTLAAYTNGLLLLLLTAWVVYEAVGRLIAPPVVDARVMLVVAVVGGIANFAAFLILSGGQSLNERGARAHVLSDLLGSGAATGAAILIWAFGWQLADPLLSVGISVLIWRSGWSLTREAAHVLSEGAPAGFDGEKLKRELATVPGVEQAHHLHVWSLTGEAPIVTLHATLKAGADAQAALPAILGRLRDKFGIKHATVQIEHGNCVDPHGEHH